MRRLSPALIALLLLSACANPLAGPTCQEQAAPAMAQIQSAAREWDDANRLAGQTPRASLSVQIGALQATRRKVQDIVVPDCATAMKQALVDSMDGSINGYVAFLGQKSDTEVQASFKTASDKMQLFSSEVAKLSGVALSSPVPVSTQAPAKGLESTVELIRAYEQEQTVFRDSPLADGTPRTMGAASNGLMTLEIIGPKESPRQVSMFVSVKDFDQGLVGAGQGVMITLAHAVMPDWSEADTWIEQAVKAVSAKSDTVYFVAVGDRLVTVKRSGSNSDQTLSIEMRMA